MNRRRFRRSAPATGDSALGGAGWLYAELAMVLVIVAVGSQPPANQLLPTANDGAGVSATATPSTPPAKPGSPQGLALKSVKFTMPVAADDAAVLSTFTGELDRIVGVDARVGLILLFGTSRNPSAPVQGTRVSERVKGIIVGAGIPQLSSRVDIRTYFGGDGLPGDVTVEIFLLTGPE